MGRDRGAVHAPDGRARWGCAATVSAESMRLGEYVAMRRRGFTLIELLVVVAIIVILAGIRYSVFAATRRAAYNAACLSNLKQIGLAVSMYSQDYDEAFPLACGLMDHDIH